MLKLRPNPFRPDKPITDFDLFAGRLTELTVLVEALYQAGYGNPRHMIVTGPRGIGKSSFVNQLQSIADDSNLVLEKLKIEAGDFKFNFAVFKHRAVEGESVGQVVSSLLGKMPTKISRDNALSLVKDFVDRWKPSVSVGGIVELEYQADVVSSLSSDFVKTVKNLWLAEKDNLDGIAFVIDEVDTIAGNTNIASFLKVTTEELIESGLDKVAVFLVGITGAMDKLKEDHPSVARIFETIELLPLKDDEVKDVISRTLHGTGTIMEEEVQDEIVQIAGGFPSPIHQLGYHAFKIDTDSKIGEDDFEVAIDEMISRIKREELSKLLRKAGSGDYRRIMIAMAKHDSIDVPLADISKLIDRSTSNMSSYMKALENREIITKVDRALYRITDPLLRLYIRKLDVLEPELNYEDLAELEQEDFSPE